MIKYDASHPNRPGRVNHWLDMGTRELTTLDRDSIAAIGGDMTHPDPETYDLHRPSRSNQREDFVFGTKPHSIKER